MIQRLTREQLLDVAMSLRLAEDCSECATLLCAGWVSVPGYFDLSKLEVLGTLKIESEQECWDEYHPQGTNLWSEDAPISMEHHPYHRSDVRGCPHCKRTFLHYTEYGGYYLDERIRDLNSTLIV